MRFGDGSLWASFQASQGLLQNNYMHKGLGLCFDGPTDRKDTATQNLKNRALVVT